MRFAEACLAEGSYYSSRWKNLAVVIEGYAGLLIPSTYFLTLLYLFNADFTDLYYPESGENRVAAGRKRARVRPTLTGFACQKRILRAM